MKYCLIAIFLIAYSTTVLAQSDTLAIYFKNSNVEKIAVSQIQKISFENVSAVNDGQYKSMNLNVTGNHPNPFGEQTVIEFSIAIPGSVEILIYDNSGNQIQNLECNNCLSGLNYLVWNCLDKSYNRVQSGIYYYEVHFNNEIQSKKMIVVK